MATKHAVIMISILSMLACTETPSKINQAPEIHQIQVIPELVSTQTMVECIATAEDPDNDVLQLRYRWEDVSGRLLGEGAALQLSPTVVHPTMEIRCVADVSDGEFSVEDSQLVSVGNTDPTIDSIYIVPEDVFVDSMLDCTFTASDPDLEAVDAHIEWFREEDVLSTEQTFILRPTIVSKGEEIGCRVRVEDVNGGSATSEHRVRIQNTAPSIVSVQLRPEFPTTQDVLTCSAIQPFDLDGDELTFAYRWWVDGVQRTETGAQLTGFAVGQEILCEVIATDGEGESASQRTQVNIVNTAPRIVSVEIIPSMVVEANSPVTCVVTAEDVDGDALSTVIEWRTSTLLGSESSLTLSPEMISVGEVLSCIAMVTDAQGDTVQSSATVVVDNTPPMITVPPQITGIPRSNQQLLCNGEVIDLNDGLLSPTWIWTNDIGTVLGTFETFAVDPAIIAVGDLLTCTMQATDLNGATVMASSVILVENTAPLVSSLSVSQEEVYTNESIELMMELYDVDLNAALSAVVEWHVIAVNGQDSVVQTSTVQSLMLQSTTVQLTAILDGGFFQKGEHVYAIVTPTDNTEMGVSQTSDSVNVLNSLPTGITASMVPSMPRLGLDTIECTVLNPSTDLDGDTIQYQYDWLDASGQVIQSTQSTSMTDVLGSTVVSVPQEITCRVTPFDGEAYGATTEISVNTVFDCNCPQTTTRDFAYTYWPENFRHANFNLNGFYTQRHFLTGYYGAVFDVSTGSLLNLAQISDLSMEEALISDDSWLSSSLGSEVFYSVQINGVTHLATDFLNPAETGIHGEDNPSMLMDMGRFQQHIEIPEILYQGNTDLVGSLSLVSSPQHLVLSHRLTSSTAYNSEVRIQITLAGDLWTQSEVSVLDGSRAVEVLDIEGQHWAVIAPEITDSIVTLSDGSIEISRTLGGLSVGEQIHIPVLLLPADQLSSAQLMMYLYPEESIEVTYAQLNQSDGQTTSTQTALWDWERGAFRVPLGSIQGSGASGGSANWSNGTNFNLYNRHRLEITQLDSTSVHVPLFLDGPVNTTFNITGGVGLFRDENRSPTGLPLQISKNWHLPGYWPNWFHLYSTPLVPTGSHSLELTIASGKWGETFAASHAQLSLVGWGANQQWDESALGAWGESITYDPDKTLRRAMVDDVRPFLMDVAGQYNWTGNVGGADFLKYVNTTQPWREQQPTQLKSTYIAPGPVMTDVIYSGITTDDAIAFTARTHLVRTDDMVRAYYVLHYDFLTDVAYSRLALFQIAADNYSDNGFSHYAYGDSTGVLLDAPVPSHGTTGYASDTDRGIALSGEHPWVLMYDNTRTGGSLPEDVADVGFVVRTYHANINGVTILTPHLNINRTNNGGWSQMAFELGVPFDSANTVIEAGSSIDAIVEYLVIPNDVSLYYGPSNDMNSVDPTYFGTTDIMELLASENTITVQVSIGTLEQMQPTILNAVDAQVAVQFQMTGGFGYSPITIQGLFRGDGWQLQSFNNGAWEPVDQSVRGQDYWQTRWDESTATYALTFSIDIDVPTQFRLVLLDTE